MTAPPRQAGRAYEEEQVARRVFPALRERREHARQDEEAGEESPRLLLLRLERLLAACRLLANAHDYHRDTDGPSLEVLACATDFGRAATAATQRCAEGEKKARALLLHRATRREGQRLLAETASWRAALAQLPGTQWYRTAPPPRGEGE